MTNHVVLDSPRKLLRFFADLHDSPVETLRTLTIDAGKSYAVIESGGGSAHLVADPDLARQLLPQNMIFQKPESFRQALNFFGGEGVFASTFHKWKKQKSQISPYFNTRSIKERFDVMRDLIDESLQTLQDDDEIIPYDFCRVFALRIFCKTVFSDDPGPDKCSAISKAMDEANIRMADVLSDAHYQLKGQVPPVPAALKKAVLPLLRYINEQAELRLALTEAEQPADILASIIERVKKEQPDSQKAARQIKEEIYHLMLGGHETTGAAVSWALYNLAHRLDIQQELQDEIDRYAPGGVLDNPDTLKQMPFLAQVRQETLRRHPSPFVSFPREATQDFNAHGLDIKKGDKLFILIDAIHHDPRWYAQPGTFDPAHFAPDRDHDRPNLAFIPFLAGPHFCPGRTMFMQVSDIALTSIFGRYSVAPLPENTEVPAPGRSISGAPPCSIPLRVTRRMVC